MGSFDISCNLTGIGICPGEKIVAVLCESYNWPGKSRRVAAIWKLAAPPIFGTYDDYGRISFDPDQSLLGKDILDWWVQAGHKLDESDDYTPRQTWGNVTELKRVIQDESRIYDNLAIFMISRDVWNELASKPVYIDWKNSCSVEQLRSEISSFVTSELELIKSCKDQYRHEANPERQRYLSEVLDRKLYRAFIRDTYAEDRPTSSVGILMYQFASCFRGYTDRGFVSGSGFSEWVRINLAPIVRSENPDIKQLEELVSLCIDLMAIEEQINWVGLSLGPKPHPAQDASENFEAQRDYYKAMSKIMTNKIKRIKKMRKYW